MSGSRREALRSFGATAATVDELLEYCTSRFHLAEGADIPELPMADEPHITVWREYADRAVIEGAASVLRSALVQMSFPIREGISATEEYAAATRRGRPVAFMASATGLELEDPERITLELHPSPGGTLPVITAHDRADFESLVQALTRKSEPWPVPRSMGSVMVAGLANWDRVSRERAAFFEEDPDGDWDARFREIASRPERVRDRFVILAHGPYSGVEAADLGLDEADWLARAHRLRAAHEATHYFTRRVFDLMRNNALDEVLADYMGCVEAFGSYGADAALRFFGLEEEDAYRDGGRLQNYADPPISPAAFEVLCRIVRRACRNLEAFDRTLSRGDRDLEGRSRTLLALAGCNLDDLAGDDAAARIGARRTSAEHRP